MIYKKTELFANLAIIVVALLLGFALVKKSTLDRSSRNPDPGSIKVGSKISPIE
jgi:hypothetical protein